MSRFQLRLYVLAKTVPVRKDRIGLRCNPLIKITKTPPVNKQAAPGNYIWLHRRDF